MLDYEANTELACSAETCQVKPRMLQDVCEVGPRVMAKGKAHRFECHTKEIIAAKERRRLDSSAVRVFLHPVTDTWYGCGEMALGAVL